MKIVRISLLLLILSVVIVSGCKVAEDSSDKKPETLLGDGAASSEEVVNSGLQELNEIDSLEEELDLGLDDLEKMELE